MQDGEVPSHGPSTRARHASRGLAPKLA
jgi:hypothetical protein